MGSMGAIMGMGSKMEANLALMGAIVSLLGGSMGAIMGSMGAVVGLMEGWRQLGDSAIQRNSVALAMSMTS